MRLYGLTGGIGSGKTEAAARFETHGIPVIDADRIGHDALAPGGKAEAAVRGQFGEEIFSCGRIDREKLGARVFTDETARARLNAIVHPVIFEEIGTRCREYAVEGHAAALVEAALLGEHGRKEPFLDGLVLVLCPLDLRVRRLLENRDLTEAEARQRMAAQTPPETKRPLADWVIENTGPVEALHAQVDAVVEAIHADTR